MRPAHIIEIVTPKKFILNGLWFGPKKPKRAIIWLHGLTSSAFSKLDIVEKLTDRQTAVMTFNNRGHSNVARIARTSGKNTLIGGGAFEKFEDCVDDIQGAVSTARRQGAREIYLVGHSTGCQKAAYWAYKKGSGIRGIVHLAPMSDYAGAVKKYGMARLASLVRSARVMQKKGRTKQFVHAKFWEDEPNTPQRFISLYTSDSVEQSIFSYFDETKPSRIFRAIKTPQLVLFAEHDEYADRPVEKMFAWFAKNTGSTYFRAGIVPNVGHSFRGGEKRAAHLIAKWISR